MQRWFSAEAIAAQQATMRRECGKLTAAQLRALYSALTEDIAERLGSRAVRLSRWVPWTTTAEGRVWERVAVRDVVAECISRVSAL